MRVTKDFILLFIYLLTITFVTARQAVVVQKTKLCGDEICNKVLFTSKVVRSLTSNHPSFLEVQENVLFEVTAIKFSDRVDIMEGRIKGVPQKRGIVFYSALDKGPYVEFLREAITTKRILQQVVQDPASSVAKVLSVVQAELDLVRDYNVQATAYAVEQNLPNPEEIPVPTKPTAGHGHSHGAHGHSHDAHGHSHDAHGHSHDAHGHSHDAHGHSHEADHAHETPKSPEVPKPEATIEKPTPQPEVPSVPEVPKVENVKVPVKVKPAKAINKVGTKSKVDVAVNDIKKEVPSGDTEDTKKNVKDAATQVDTYSEPEEITNVDVKKGLDSIEKELEEMMRRDEILSQNEKRNAEAQSSTTTISPNEEIPEDPTQGITVEVESLPVPEPEQVSEPVTLPPITLESVVPNQMNIKPSSVPPPVEASTLPPPLEVPTPAPEEEASTQLPPQEASTLPPPQEDSTVPTPIEVTTVPPPIEETVIPPAAVPVEETVEEAVPLPKIELPRITIPPITINIEQPVTQPPPAEPISEDLWKNTPLTNEDQGVCDGDDCQKIIATPSTPEMADPLKANPFEEGFSNNFDPLPDVPPQIPVEQSFLGNLIKSLLNVVRTILPIGDLSDAGAGLVLNLLFVITAMTIYFVSYFLSDSGDSLHFDRRAAHDLATKCKELQEQLRQKDEEIQRVGTNSSKSQEHLSEISALRLELEPVKFERTQLSQRLSQAQSDLARESSEKESLQKSLDKLREHITQYESNAEQTESRVKEISSEFEKANKELRETKNALERVEKDLISEREKLKKLVSDYESSIEEVRQKENEISNLREKENELFAANEQLKSELKVASEMFSMDEPTRKADADATESGGSGGWSDFGDEPEYEEKVAKERSTPPSADIRELIKMRAQQTKLEQECQLVKQQLERAVEEKNKIEELYSIAQKDLLRKTKEVEQRDSERIGADERANKLLSLIDSNASKLKDTENTCDKLRDDLQRLRENMLDIQEEKRQKEDKIKELDSELKKVRSEFAKLEHKSFHQVFDLRRKLEEAQLVQPKIAESSFEMPNLSSSSIDADPSSRDAPELLWADDRPTRHRTMSPQEEYGMDGMPIVKKSSRGRRSDKLLREPFSSDGERREKKDGAAPSRRRSRSHGRQPMPMHNYLPGYGMPPPNVRYHENGRSY